VPAKTYLDWNKCGTFFYALKKLCRHFWCLCRHFFVPAIWIPDIVRGIPLLRSRGFRWPGLPRSRTTTASRRRMPTGKGWFAVQPNHHRLAAEDANGQRLATSPSRWRASMRAERSLLGSASARGGRDQADGHGHPVDAAYGSYLRRELGDCAAGRSRAPVACRLLVLRAASCSSSSILYSRRRWLCRMSEYF
jgi:hypothetical protein